MDSRHVRLLLLLLVLLQACSVTGQVSKSENPGKITATFPDAARVLPAYPSFEDKEAFFNDSLFYRRGQAMRNTVRGGQAVKDAEMSFDFYLKRYGEVMGVALSEQGSPAIVAYLKALFDYTGQGIKSAKGVFDRERPFRYFCEPSAVPADENTIGKASSYPSGHAIIAWIVSLALSSIDEEHQYGIINLGYELGQSRVIVGFHFQSDVDAGRLAASAAYSRIVSDPEFIRLMNLAREELRTLKAGPKNT